MVLQHPKKYGSRGGTKPKEYDVCVKSLAQVEQLLASDPCHVMSSVVVREPWQATLRTCCFEFVHKILQFIAADVGSDSVVVRKQREQRYALDVPQHAQRHFLLVH